jgi:hypothetical protein
LAKIQRKVSKRKAMAIPLSVVPDGRRALSADWIRLCGLLLLVLSLGSCDRNSYLRPFGYDRASLLKRYTPQDDESLAIDCVDLLQQGRYEEIEKRLDPSMKNSKTRESLAEMASFFPSKPISTKTVDASVVRSRDSSITSITLQYEFARGWLLAQLVIQTRDGLKTIGGFHVTPIAESVEVMNEFTFADKGISQYAGLVLAIFVSIFALYEFVLCIRTKMGREKWFWAILILIGAGRLTLNWTTGQWFFTPLAVQAPPVMMFCTPYGPWMVHITVPLGAIAFLLRRKSLAAKVTSSPIQSPTIAQ